MAKLNLYYIEVTDTFCGDANYSWATHHVIKGKSMLGAIQRFSRLSGISWHSVGAERYDSKSGQTCFFIKDFDANYDLFHKLGTDDSNL